MGLYNLIALDILSGFFRLKGTIHFLSQPRRLVPEVVELRD